MTHQRFDGSTAPRRLMFMAIALLSAVQAIDAQERGPQARPWPTIDAGWGDYQDASRGPEQTDRLSRTFKAAQNTWLDLANISGDIDLSGGPGGDIVIDAVKHVRARDGRAQDLLAALSVDIVERPGRIEVRTLYPRGERRGSAWVDYTVRVPAGTSVSLKSVSGDIRVTNVKGELRLESVSGDVRVDRAGRLAFVKSMSGDVTLTDISSSEDLTAGSVSGNFVATGLEARILDLNTVSGDLILGRMRCERAMIRSVSGNIEYDGPLAKRGRYEFNAHSGDVRLGVPADSGFEFEASTFSGSLNTGLPAQSGERDRNEPRRFGPDTRSVRGTIGDGSAFVIIRTFSGDVSLTRR